MTARNSGARHYCGLSQNRRRWHKANNNRPVLVALVLFVAASVFAAGIYYTAIRSVKEDLSRSSNPCLVAVDRIKHAQIQLVAFDFDATIIDIHTGGRWTGTADDLTKHIRPDFQCFIKSCLERDIHVSVATFSTQTDLISAVLEATIDNPHANSIPVFGNNDRVENYDQGKQSQLLLAINHFNQNHSQRAVPITPNTTLLVDDDADNIQVAKADGYNTIHYQPGSSIDRSRLTKASLPEMLNP